MVILVYNIFRYLVKSFAKIQKVNKKYNFLLCLIIYTSQNYA